MLLQVLQGVVLFFATPSHKSIATFLIIIYALFVKKLT